MMRWLFTFLLLPMVATARFPQACFINNELTPLNRQGAWMVDSSAKLPMESVWNGGFRFVSGRFVRTVENLPGEMAYFCGFSIHQPEGSPVFIVMENTLIDTMEVWYSYKGHIEKQRMGALLPLPALAEPTPNFTLRIPTDGTEQQVLIRYRSASAIIVPSFISNVTGVEHLKNIRSLTEFILLGILIALTAYNILQLLVSGSLSYLYYLGYLLNLVFFVYLYVLGYANLLPESWRFVINQYGLFSCATIILLCLCFTWHHVPAKLLPYRQRKEMRILIAVAATTLPVVLIWPQNLGLWLVELQGFLFPLFHLRYTYLAARIGDKGIRIYFLSSLVTNTAFVLYVLSLVDVVSFSWVSLNYTLLLAFFFEMVFMTISLAFRTLADRREKEALKTSLLQVVETRKAELEAEVVRQTQALRSALKELEQSSMVKTKLLSIISHDLRLPFVTLTGTLDLLEMGILPPERVRQKIQHISSSIRQIALTLENLLTWSKSQQQKIHTQPEKLHLLSVVQDCVDLLREAITNKELAVFIEIPESFYVSGDHFQITCVTRNLLSNAIKASPVAGSLRITALRDGSACTIELHDQGKGIEETSLDELLRNDAPLKPYSIANGLGLQICREFLANHQSQLHYSFATTGTCFSFSLPAAC